MDRLKLSNGEYDFAFNMYAAAIYEAATGRNALDIDSEFNGKIANLLQLCFCIIDANNESAPNDYGNWLRALTWEDTQAAVAATSAAVGRFFAPTADDEKAAEQENADAAKNA